MYKQILIPTDGSECSDLATNHGLGLAKALGANVTFLHALEDPISSVYAAEFSAYSPDIYASLKKSAKAVLARAQSLADEQGVSAETVLAERIDPVKAIHAAETEADLVVMGTHGRRGFNRVMFGSVAEGALRRSTIPYLMIRSEGYDAED